ncbi:hypothetical protein CHS0354_028005 [Potamilus streckersoni]|uniref:Midasin n=1 Tax=Potamilus streckersoni TaxID=2493646 RepID=A0AAE0T4G9_9BIVA|nr:hypothetical protein CHS0354_028005 [Potamilus streckersoni]
MYSWKTFETLDHLCKQNSFASTQLSQFLSKQIWNASDRQELLDRLAKVFVYGCAKEVAVCFQPLLLEIVTRARNNIISHSERNNISSHQNLVVALSQCLELGPEIRRFTVEYLQQQKQSFLPAQCETDGEPKAKRIRKTQCPAVDLCQAAWRCARSLGPRVWKSLPLGRVFQYLSHTDTDVRWFSASAVMELQGMSAGQRHQLLSCHFNEEEIIRLSLKWADANSDISCSTTSEAVSILGERIHTSQSHTMHCILDSDLSPGVACVGGILLPVWKTETSEQELRTSLFRDLLPVPSTEVGLHHLALAVSTGRPVLLQGPVGCGKTSLVQHLAAVTGRNAAPHLMKIQLGDQMDSKALLGTYRCTEVPGEFMWQPGVLMQAVTQGYWVLLEDIDLAPMDVISVLLPLLETNTLTVLGHGDSLLANPRFQLFATRRLLGGSSGWHRQQAGSSMLLEKMWTQVMVEPLSRNELQQVICSRWPQLTTVVDKLLDIYFLLSSQGHQMKGLINEGQEEGDNLREESDVCKIVPAYEGRLISTRDLMNWCARIAGDFDVSSAITGTLVFQEALDCFVFCLSNPTKRLSLAEAIGAKLNITKVKVEYFCYMHKPVVSISSSTFTVGRVTLPRKGEELAGLNKRHRNLFSFTRQSTALLERVGVCVYHQEPVLLVGETGTGKTSVVQYLAEQLGHKLHVINMNQQSDSADLLGGFKPVDLRHVIKPFKEDFELLFCQTFSMKQNAKFLGHIQECFSHRQWANLFTLIEHTHKAAIQKVDKDPEMLKRWECMGHRLKKLQIQVKQIENTLAFTFIEGTLVKALRSGDWVLLDEINLATAETLECLGGLLESSEGSVVLMERGDTEPVIRHKDFRLFACMNPATDVGKKDLTPGIRNRFTELYVDELEGLQDLKILVGDYLIGLSLSTGQVEGIVKFYQVVRKEAVDRLTDGTGHRPFFSLRSLCRALKFAASNRCGTIARSLYESFCLSFLTELDRSSYPVVEQLICRHILGGKSNVKSILKQPLPKPPDVEHLQFEGYWISKGTLESKVPENYVLTPSVRANLRDLARIVSTGNTPVLLQGETSVGKTSLITWLAQSSGNVCVRVNNHEHTDIQEYLGCYAADDSGKLVFKEGVLVEAMRKGHWIILDELNLAPTDVLEALNRLLDDNRELFISETQETVKAHPKFMLFATQNPPGQYGGRKMLSRAFRNRFIELHFDDIPSEELEIILHQRCSIPMSYAKRMIAVLLDLQTRRRGSGVFAGKSGFMTLRDLFRWAERYNCSELPPSKFYDWDKHHADQGFMLLAGRVRKTEEGLVIQEVLEKHFRCSLDPRSLFTLTPNTPPTNQSILNTVLSQSAESFEHVVWTFNMRRLAVLIGQAIKYKEPILLVGETGCGKTTVCQIFGAVYKKMLHTINCHLHTESADFLGGLRPVRSHVKEDGSKESKLFEWVDGLLVMAMKEGSMFLIDEISLADDSVLERLNSVLEPERTLLLAEKGGGDGGQNEVEEVVARKGFQVFATMNPGGDFGKKELSPALRNRFTEIWCPPADHRQDLIDIIEHNLLPGIHLCNQEDGTSGIGKAILDFVEWFTNNTLGKRCTVSIRDLLSWVRFINQCARTLGEEEMGVEEEINADRLLNKKLDPAVAFVHGACLVFLDGLGSGRTSQANDFEVDQFRGQCLNFLCQQVSRMTHQEYQLNNLSILARDHVTNSLVMVSDDMFCIAPFGIKKGEKAVTGGDRYALQAPGTCINAQRILRALQLQRPLLLEGSPGVGKTSLVAAIARTSGRELVRINLSEQTDISDLFGADLPVEGAEGGVFAWRDGPLLQALKAGDWVVFDELNLASQSVLEGLNACLDHRGEIFVPELGRIFQIQHNKTRIFACQNPLNQGGGRKGLPRSFLNRFTQVYIEPLSRDDLLFIATKMYPDIPFHLLGKMVDFNQRMYEETVVRRTWGQRGGPWEFNLRDIFRWSDLMIANQSPSQYNPGEYVGLVYRERIRSLEDREMVNRLFESMFPPELHPLHLSCGIFHCGTSHVQVGHSILPIKGQGLHHKDHYSAKEILHHNLSPLEAVMKCIHMTWMVILVGPQSCGKTSVVDILSSLTGNRLHILSMNSEMDTIELLGGFEQSDLGRHLEELSHDIEGTLIELSTQMTQSKMSSASLHSVNKLQELWQNYKSTCKKGDQLTTVETLEVMKKQVESLQAVMDSICILLKDNIFQEERTKSIVEDLKNRLRYLSKRVQDAVPGGEGGMFEWVDSVLVKALKSGDWLLIDNVNFCSPSVLDRLNSLLEPNGVLTINERGIIDGKIPTITPHHDFRLFLAMDPKYGEISRAMRNRGVEIYIPGEEDGVPYSEHDMKLLFSNVGLSNTTIFTWLLRVHQTLREMLPPGDRPSVETLLQAAHTMRQLLDHGMTAYNAVITTCHTVYTQRQLSTRSRQICQKVLSDQPSLEYTTKPVHELGFDLVHLPDTDLYLRDPALARVRWNSYHLLYIIRQFEASPADSAVEQNSRLLKSALTLVLNMTASGDFRIIVNYLQSQFKSRPLLSLLPAPCKEAIDRLPVVFDKIVELLKILDYERTITASKAESEHMLQLLRESPADLRWNQQLLDFIIRQIPTDSGSGEELQKLFNRVSFCGHTMLELTMMHPIWTNLKNAVDNDKSRGRSKLPAAVVHLTHLFPALEKCLLQQTTSFHLNSYTDVIQFLAGLRQLRFLLLRAEEVIGSVPRIKGAFQDSNLSLHWHWLQKQLLTHLLDESQLKAITCQLQRLLGEEGPQHKVYVRFRKSWGHPPPYSTQKEAEYLMTLSKLDKFMNLHINTVDLRLGVKVKVIPTQRRRILEEHKKVMSSLANKNQGFIEESISALSTLLSKLGLQPTDWDTMETNSADQNIQSETYFEDQYTDSLPVSQLCLWPLFDYVAMLSKWSLLSGGKIQRGKTDRISSAVNFYIQFTALSPALVQFCKNLQESNLADKLGFLLDQQMVSMATHYPDRWLTWSHGEHPGSDTQTDVSAGQELAPVTMHQAVLSYILLSLLSTHEDRMDKKNKKEEMNQLAFHSSLKKYKERIVQLNHISSQLWTHAHIFSSSAFQARNLEVSCLTQTVIYLLEKLKPLITPEGFRTYESLLKDVFQSLTDMDQVGMCPTSHLREFLASHLLAGDVTGSITELLMDVLEDLMTQGTLHDLFRLGSMWVRVGLVLLQLLVPQGSVDPVEKKNIKMENMKEELAEVMADIEVYSGHHRLATGHNLEEVPSRLVHPHVTHIYRRRKELLTHIEMLSTQLAFRPQPSQYSLLTSEVSHYLASVGSPSHVTSLMAKLQHICSGVTELGQEILQEVELWEKTQEKFKERLKQDYPLYIDIVEPIITAISQVLHGMRLLRAKARQTIHLLQLTTAVPSWCKTSKDLSMGLERHLTMLCRFPTTCDDWHTCGQLASTLCADHSLQQTRAVVQVFGETEEVNRNEQYIFFRLLQSSLLHVRNEALLRGEVTEDLLSTLSIILRLVISSWEAAEDRRRRAEEENASLYRYKSQTHGDERNDEAIEEEEFRESFPVYLESYQDLVEPNELGDGHSHIIQHTTEKKDDGLESHILITESDMYQMCRVHSQVFSGLVGTEWYKPVSSRSLQSQHWAEPVLSSYSVAVKFGKLICDKVSCDVDSKLLGGHLLVSTTQQAFLTSAISVDKQEYPSLLSVPDVYDIYHDPNVSEVIQCQPVLDHFVLRVNQLLSQWPDHPTLKQLLLIVDRILGFPVVSPIIKFLTGLELLLQKAQDWESNASRHVSMVTELGEISALIVQWRKLELNCWNKALDNELKKVHQQASKWWFYLYQIIMAALQDESKSNDPQGDVQGHSTSESKKSNKGESSGSGQSELVKTLQQFVEQSSLGDFQVRLDMLLAYHCQLVTMETTPIQGMLMSLFWNLYQFYSQFSSVVKDELTRLRKPLEKEMKGFVKIARWSDMNYWSLKQTTEKTHRTLHKYIKRFQDILKQPVKGILDEKDSFVTMETSGATWFQALKQHQQGLLTRLLSYQTPDIPPVITEQIDRLPLQSRLPGLCKRWSKHWHQIICGQNYDTLTVALDEFTGELVEAIHELQSLEVSQGEDREKQKSEAKHINLRKRHALADLFKYLTKLGLSYRKGLALSADEIQYQALHALPLDITVLAADNTDSSDFDTLVRVWSGCQQYYYRCITRKAKFTTSLQTPAQDLGLANIERTRGFSDHLFSMMVSHYLKTAKLSRNYYKLRNLAKAVTNLKERKRINVPQSQAKEWMKSGLELLVQIQEGLSQFLVLLACCPVREKEPTVYPSPFPQSDLPPAALLRHGDQDHEHIRDTVQSLIKDAADTLQKVCQALKKEKFTWIYLECLNDLFACIGDLSDKLAPVSRIFTEQAAGQSGPLNSTLDFLITQIISTVHNFQNWAAGQRGHDLDKDIDLCPQGCTDKVNEFCGALEEVVSTILLTVQKLSRAHVSINSECHEPDKSQRIETETEKSHADSAQRTETEVIEGDIKDGHLVQLILQPLSTDLDSINVAKILPGIEALLSQLYELSDQGQASHVTFELCCWALTRCCPLLDQYVQLVHHQLVHCLVTHRTQAKLLSVLLGLFTELAAKGFCPPPEFSEELLGEGATQFEDIQGGGIGEGEGMKDVSDQIETEDQLEDLKKPGEERQEDSSQQPDIPNEDNAIEMSTEFDGKLHDLEPTSQEEDENTEDSSDKENELDRQMGEVDEKDANKLDEQMWGSDDEENADDKEESMEEYGQGSGKQSEAELVAKDDNQSGTETKKKSDQQEQQQEAEEEEEKTHNLDEEMIDEVDYDDNRVDPHHNKENEDQTAPQALDLPEDLNLDNGEEEEKEEQGEGVDDMLPGEIETKEETKLPAEDEANDKGQQEGQEGEEKEEQTTEQETAVQEEEQHLNEEVKEERVQDKEEEKGKEEKGEELEDALNSEQHSESVEDVLPDEEKEGNQVIEHHGKTSHDTQMAEMSDTAVDQAGQQNEATVDNQDEGKETGMARSEQTEGHTGQRSSQATDASEEGERKKSKRKPGQSDDDRSLGSTDQKYKKLKTTEKQTKQEDQEAEEQGRETDLYEHIKDSTSHYDAQTLDVATVDQQQQAVPNKENEEVSENEDTDVKMEDLEVEEEECISENLLPTDLKSDKQKGKDDKGEGSADEAMDIRISEDPIEIPGERQLTATVPRGLESTIHTEFELLKLGQSVVDMDALRAELEIHLGEWNHPRNLALGEDAVSSRVAAEAWQRYEALMSNLSQELCEQLRLILEPTQASKFKGDYRTGKRLNMRKVIPFIASQFRKDKIWLRRTKPSKRQYQIMLAIDDSSSMLDNHSKQMAFESLALVSNALTLLEAGSLAICSFGETVNLLHPFFEPFSSQSGAKLLQFITFEQKKTRIAQLLKQAALIMTESRTNLPSGAGSKSEISQLLFMVSDGRGLFMEGMDVVKTAVRQAQEANIFLVFIILDNPQNKDSILDIRVPVFKGAGQLPEIKSYMDHFPFPFYIILRDINSLPHVLSDALRQWFELITAADR